MASTDSLQMNWLPLQTRKGGPLGLKNLGNSCYLNSVLQCLTYTPPLANFCLLSHHSSSCTFINGSSSSVCLFCLVEKRISRSLSVDSVSESPARIHSCLTLFAKHFRQGWQEDAHEFLRYVIEACNSVCVTLHKMLAASKLRTRQDSQKISKEEPRTVVKDIFGGILQSQVKCLSCNAESNKLDDIMDLSLDAFKTSSVKEAMCRYFQPEVLDGSNKYRCEKCKKLTAARKQMSVFQAPNVLVIQLKRFENIYGGKIDWYISFDERLELHGHMSCESKDQRPEYFLYAVIVHSGYSQDSGHYYSYVKDVHGKWYRCNDAHVTSVTAKSVLSEKAYILFYVRHTTKYLAKVSEGATSANWTSTLAERSKPSPLESQEFSAKGNRAMKMSSLAMVAVETQEPSTKQKRSFQRSDISSGCGDKGEGAQLVRFNIMKPGPHNKVRKSLSGENERAERSLLDLEQVKRSSSNGAVSNGGLKHFDDSKNDSTEFQKQEHKQKQCSSAGKAERVSNANGSSCSELLVKSNEQLGQKVASNGNKGRVSCIAETEGTDPDSNVHSERCVAKVFPSSCNRVSQQQQANLQLLTEISSGCSCIVENEKVKKTEKSLPNGGVKRKLPNGLLVEQTLKGKEHSQEMIGELVVTPCAQAESLLEEESIKHWLATESREWLVQSGWCETVRNSFRELKRVRLIQDSQSGGRKAENFRGNTFASVHDSLRQEVPKELKEHLVERLHAHFAAQRLKGK